MEYTNGEFVVTGANATANIFASYPAKHLSVLNGFVDQVGLKTNFFLNCLSVISFGECLALFFYMELLISMRRQNGENGSH